MQIALHYNTLITHEYVLYNLPGPTSCLLVLQTVKCLISFSIFNSLNTFLMIIHVRFFPLSFDSFVKPTALDECSRLIDDMDKCNSSVHITSLSASSTIPSVSISLSSTSLGPSTPPHLHIQEAICLTIPLNLSILRVH